MTRRPPLLPDSGMTRSFIVNHIHRFMRAAHRFTTNSGYRSIMILRWRKPSNLFQISNVTAPDRYPLLFGLARDTLGDGPELNILSFGCSTGDEVFSLRRYFVNANIRGLDINPHNIAVCRHRLSKAPDSKISFAVADSVRNERPVAYDAVFCMAVFRHGALAEPTAERCGHLITFSNFDRTITEIARRIKPGGLLFNIYSNFRFRDAEAARDFDVFCKMHVSDESGVVTPIFDRHDCRTSQVNDPEVAFRKRTEEPSTTLDIAGRRRT